MNVREVIDSMLEGNLEAMRENISQALAEKAASNLEERKIQLAANYFEQN